MAVSAHTSTSSSSWHATHSSAEEHIHQVVGVDAAHASSESAEVSSA
jgi:hypothetical protein